MFERIGKIISTQLGIEDHGIMTFMLMFDFGGKRQGFGGYCLDTYDPISKKRVGTAEGCDAILQILNACGVSNWEEIRGKAMYALYDSEGFGHLIKGIKSLPFGHGGTLLMENWQKQWFPEEVK